MVEGLPADGSDAGLRDDVDEEGAGVVILRGEAVARDVDRLDLRLRWERRAFEAVHANHRTGAGQIVQLLPQNVGIIREGVDLLASQRGTERVLPIRGRFLFVASDRDLVRELQNGERQRLLVLADPDADVGIDLRVEPRKLRFDGVPPWAEVREGRNALLARDDRRDLCGFGRAVHPNDGHDRAGQHAAGLVDDRESQSAVAGCLRETGRDDEQGEQADQAGEGL
jgi:hypothetical protein